MFWLTTQCHGILDFKVFQHSSNFFLWSLFLVNITLIIFISYFQNKKMKQTVQVLRRSPLRRLLLVVSSCEMWEILNIPEGKGMGVWWGCRKICETFPFDKPLILPQAIAAYVQLAISLCGGKEKLCNKTWNSIPENWTAVTFDFQNIKIKTVDQEDVNRVITVYH